MAFRIRNNYEADIAITNLYMNKTKLSKVEQQLSTGLRIVRAADDATDLFIADHLKQTYVGLERGTLNAQYGLSAARVVDDALGRIYDTLVKIKDKIVEAANAHTDAERKQAQQQINEYVRNIAQIVEQTEFDGHKLLAGDSYATHFGSHIDDFLIINGNSLGQSSLAISAAAGATASAKANISFTQKYLVGFDYLAGGRYQLDLTISTVTIQVAVQTSQLSTVEESLNEVEQLIQNIDQIRGYYAGIENKLQNIIENNQIMVDNLKEGENVVRNVDYASAMAEFQKLQVITQANVAALAQANRIPQLVTQLLR